VVACFCRDLRARLEVAIEHVLELVQQVEQQKAVSPSHSRRSSVSEEVHQFTATTTTNTTTAVAAATFKVLTNLLF